MKIIPPILTLALLWSACGTKSTDTATDSNNTNVVDSAKQPANFTQVFEGLRGDDTLLANLTIANGIVKGQYFVKGKPDLFILDGSLRNDTATVYEVDSLGTKLGLFRGLFTGNTAFSGQYSKPDGSQAVGFILTASTTSFNVDSLAKLDTLTYTYTKQQRKLLGGKCEAKVQYPVFDDKKNNPIIKRINAFFKNDIGNTLKACDGVTTDEFEGRGDITYSSEAIAGVVLNNGYVIGVDVAYYDYMGGAHPNHSSDVVYFDLTTGARLKLVDVVQGPNLKTLAALAATAIKKERKAKTLTDAGLYNNTLNLTGNETFYVSATEFTLQFDPYEIGPYAAGDFEATIPLKDILPLINQRSVFAKFVK